jgi:DNA/RNA-binding domain of Phe-tRNA-synthetase-like protein
MTRVRYYIDPATCEIGVRTEFAVIRDVTVQPRDLELNRWRRPIQRELREIDLDSDPILVAYRDLLSAVGASDAVASPEYLLRLLQKNGKLPEINTVVDAYNVVSAQFRAVISAHDLGCLSGTLRMIRLTEAAPFEPLGSAPMEMLPAGEFTIRDDRHLLCRLNCKQSRLSSVTLSTRDLLLYAQGNPCLEGDALRAAMDAACEAIIRFSGGERESPESIAPAA